MTEKNLLGRAFGRIFDIKEFSVHDGPGCRVTVFFKGCPIHCLWCHNPEGQNTEKELMAKNSFCRACGACTQNKESESFKKYGRDISACPENLLSEVGKDYAVKELTDKIISYRAFFESMDGGVTFSGGEPLMQGEFLIKCLEILKKEGIHTALETCGHSDSSLFERVLEKTDYVMYDIKLFDSGMHKKYTGVSNEKILKNAEILKKSGKAFVFRTPMIPSITDTEENLSKIAEFTKGYVWEKIPYNNLAGAKYPHMGRKYTLEI